MRRMSPRYVSLKVMPFALRHSKSMFILSMSRWGLWVAESFIEYAAYISAAISEMPGVPNLVLKLVQVSVQVVPMWGWSVCEMQEPIMPYTCSEFSSQAACAKASARVGAFGVAEGGQTLPPLVMWQRCWDLRKSPIFCSQIWKSEPIKMGTEALRLLLLVVVAI